MNNICQNCKKNFEITQDDLNFYEKIKVPSPTFCPDCRNQRRMSWRNERTLYKRKCNAPGHDEEIISMYDLERKYIVYDAKFWWSDKWDPIEYGFSYDFSKNFFKQFSDLLKHTPLAPLSVLNSVNSEYTNFVDGNKNCYLIFGSGWSENTRYGNKIMSCKDSQDLLMCTKCELSYECVGCVESYKLIWSKNCKNCTDSFMLYNCRNCINCFGCSNLVSKSYCIWNKQFTREEYLKELEKLETSSYKKVKELKEKFMNEIYLQSIHRYANIFNSIDSTGDNINHSKNCKNCFDIYENVEDSKYLYSAIRLKDSYDGNGVYENELSYEYVDCNVGAKNLATIIVYDSQNVRYSFNCHNCKDCFGCTGLRSKQYCILNKQYTKKDYEIMIHKIINHMNEEPYKDRAGKIYGYGEFFPTEISPFYYNETIAQEYFPIEIEQAKKAKYDLKEKEIRNYDIEIVSEELPDLVENVNEEITGKAISCEHFTKNIHDSFCDFACTEAFKIFPEDLLFYKRLNIPLPRICPNCRHYERLKQKNTLKLWHRKCMKEGCKNEFETSYSPDRPEIVYCETCYNQEIY